MKPEESLQFVQDRLRDHHHGPRTRSLGLGRPQRVRRRFAVELAGRQAKVFQRVDETVQVHCSSGSIWITHDGDCKDVILQAGECYRVERSAAMHLFALQDCVLEIEFEDDVTEH